MSDFQMGAIHGCRRILASNQLGHCGVDGGVFGLLVRKKFFDEDLLHFVQFDARLMRRYRAQAVG